MSDSQVKCIDISGLDPYPEYKGSRIKWIGEIPQHWNLNRLKFLSNIKTGERDTIDKDDNGEYPFFVRSQTAERINTYSYDGEAILTAGDGVGVGKVFHYYNGKFNYHQRVYKISDFTKVLGKYLFYYMRENFHKEVLKISAKSTVDSLRRPMFLDFPVVYGTIEEQQAIANFLDCETSRIDTLIEKKQYFIELLEEKRVALISHTVTKGLDTDVPTKDSGIEWIGEIPEGWEVNKLKHSASINPNVLPENTDPEFVLRYVDIGNVGLGKMVDSPKEMKFRDAPSRARKVVQENDIIISTVRTYLKAILHIISPEPNLIVSTGFAVLRPRSFVNHRYLFYLIRSNQFINSVMSHSEGVGYPAINSSSLGDLPICYPPLSEQKAIASYLDSETAQIDVIIEKIKQSIEYLKEYHTALISDVVTGKIDVRGTVCE